MGQEEAGDVLIFIEGDARGLPQVGVALGEDQLLSVVPDAAVELGRCWELVPVVPGLQHIGTDPCELQRRAGQREHDEGVVVGLALRAEERVGRSHVRHHRSVVVAERLQGQLIGQKEIVGLDDVSEAAALCLVDVSPLSEGNHQLTLALQAIQPACGHAHRRGECSGFPKIFLHVECVGSLHGDGGDGLDDGLTDGDPIDVVGCGQGDPSRRAVEAGLRDH